MSNTTSETLDTIIRFANYNGYVGGDNALRNLIKSEIQERVKEAQIQTAKHIQETMVSPAGGYCDEISPNAIPDYIAELTKEEGNNE